MTDKLDVLFLLFVVVPSAMVYAGAIAGVALLLMRRRSGWAALLRAVAFVAIAAILLSVPGNLVTAARERAVTAAKVTPARRIALSGDVLIDPVFDFRRPDSASAHWEVVTDDLKRMRTAGRYDEAHGCGAICRTLLATPGVRGVVVNPEHGALEGVSRFAVRYRLAPPGACGVIAGNSWDVMQSVRALAPGPDSCVVAGPPPSRYDFALRRIEGTLFARPDGSGDLLQVDLLPRPVSFLQAEIVDARGRVLLRRSAVPTSIALPLIGLAMPIRIGLTKPTNDVEVDAGPEALSMDRVLLAATSVRAAR